MVKHAARTTNRGRLDLPQARDSNRQMAEDIVLVLGAYLLGSIATAILTCRVMGLPDPRTQGSGNPGATNVLRTGGRKAAAITLLGDALKGLLPVLVGKLLGVEPAVVAATALAAFLGHLYPVFFGFRGGKGVATAFGAMLGLAWALGGAVLATWLIMAAAFRYSSLSALTASALAPAYAALLIGQPAVIAAVALMSVLLFWRHRSNIRNLLAGTESRIGRRA